MRSVRKILCVLLLFVIARNGLSQVHHGYVQEGLIIKSKILKKEVRYTVYLPFDYKTSHRFYPVVYLLHGYTDNDMAWIQFGEADMYADKAIDSQTIPPMILVMPDAGLTWYINNYDNSVRYEDFFFDEFIPYVESRYRIRREKMYRGIAGLSMGGYGAIVYALKHPDMFAAFAAFSPAIYTEKKTQNMDEKWWNEAFNIIYGPNLKGQDRITKHFLANNPFYIVKHSDYNKMKSVRMYIDCGDDDFLYEGNSNFHILLRDLEIPHEYRVRDGGHRWSYWRNGLINGLKFIGESFHQN